ncbi:MAG: hypothetical protein ACXVPQ_02885 [Bacteroidia bacterium]
MKRIVAALPLVFLFACSPESSQDKPTSSTDSTQVKKDSTPIGDYLLVDNFISNAITANHRKLAGVKGDFKSFKSYLEKSGIDSLTSIPFALDYINTCLAPNSPDRDSVFFYFKEKFYAVTNKLSDSLNTKYNALMEQFAKDSTTAELKAFKNNLKACGIDIFSSEGMYYLDVIPDYFYTNFKNQVSEGTAGFLDIRKDEMKEGFSEDAGMLISFEQLYQRIKRWEKFIKKYPGTVYSDEAGSYYQTYIQTLMTGMDNSRVFDYETNALLPEVKTLYEKIIREEPESATTKIIASYYAFLSRHDFKDNDSISIFLKGNDLSTMLAVQPHTR